MTTWYTTTYVDNSSVDKSLIRAGFRNNVVAHHTLTELRALTAAGLRAASVNGIIYVRNASDTTTPDDGGVTCIVSADGARFIRSFPGMTTAEADRLTAVEALADSAFLRTRETLSAARTFFVRTDGNDANNGLADNAAGAFRTVQRGVDAAATLDVRTFSVTIQVGPGTYTGAIVVRSLLLGSGLLTIRGDTTTPANVVLNNSANVVNTQLGSYCRFQGLTFTSTSGAAIVATGGSTAEVSTACAFGTCPTAHLWAERGALVNVTANYSITGNANLHYNAREGGRIAASSRTVTISNSPVIGVFAQVSRVGLIVATSNTYTNGGTVTGQRFNAVTGGTIDTSGAANTYFPGDVAGTTDTGGAVY